MGQSAPKRQCATVNSLWEEGATARVVGARLCETPVSLPASRSHEKTRTEAHRYVLRHSSDAPGSKASAPHRPPQDLPSVTARPESFGGDGILNTKRATVALREQMHLELAEVEAYSRRSSTFMPCARAQR